MFSARAEDSDVRRVRWDFDLGLSTVSGGKVGIASGFSLAYDHAQTRWSYRFVEYSDRGVTGGKGLCPLGCGHQDLLDEQALLLGWVMSTDPWRYTLQSGVGIARTQGYFGTLGEFSRPVIPIVVGALLGSGRYARTRVEGEYVMSRDQHYLGVSLGVAFGNLR